MKTLAVLGAGPGIGRAVASRFGRDGYHVGLVARDERRLAQMVDDLEAEGVKAMAFPADLGDRPATAAALDAIVDQLGPVDVLEYSPLPSATQTMRATDVTVESARAILDTFLLGAVGAVFHVLPAMVERGSGALLFTQGVSARLPLSSHASVALAGAGLRNWIYCLHEELEPKGIFVGAVNVGALVVRGETDSAFAVEPDEIAERHWDLLQARKQVEALVVPDPSLFPVPEGWV